ncbi:hypothetical protein EX895_002814 [Sporisorium graminicola]|uniref:Uncharacterized protein n=1 Tax=Sporisorium graminicola TaxID=280036 RepID=A0A4U7KU28_9BASI|nr:hypothetical protein EX895_002814 [Sporisorium graminicola]TKY88104.1 hypothetical protein EX895_002814 [Sporisorium graminicola]
MLGERIVPSPRTGSPWSARLSTSASTSASTTAPPTPPSHHPFGSNVHDLNLLDGTRANDAKDHDHHSLPALHLLNMSCDDALSDLSDEADGFFSLDMDVSIDQQLEGHAPPAPAPRNGHMASASPALGNPAVRRASETTAYSSSPLQAVGLDPIMASRSRNSPALAPVHAAGDYTANASSAANVDTANASPPSSFGPIAPEVDQKGNLEYKLKILPPSRERFDRLVTQLKWRLLEGGGLAVYEIGVLDDGTLIGLDSDSMKDSLKLLSLMAAEVRATCHVQRVLALEKVAVSANGDHEATMPAASSASSRLASSESALSLRALSPARAQETLQPYILTAPHLNEDTRTDLVETGSAGLYRFDIAEQQQQLPIPPPLADLHASPSSLMVASTVAAVDPTDTAALASIGANDAELAVSAQTKRRLLKSTIHPGSNGSAASRAKKHVLQGRDQSAIVYLPSKEEKRILRAAEAAEHDAATMAAAAPHQHEAAVDRALSHTEAQERKMMAKMTRVADSIQPKTARARARARKSVSTANAAASDSASPSPTPSPAMKAVNASSSPSITASATATGAYAGYENVMSGFGVLSERAARTLYGGLEAEAEGVEVADTGVRARLIVEAVVRRRADLEENRV